MIYVLDNAKLTFSKYVPVVVLLTAVYPCIDVLDGGMPWWYVSLVVRLVLLVSKVEFLDSGMLLDGVFTTGYYDNSLHRMCM